MDNMEQHYPITFIPEPWNQAYGPDFSDLSRRLILKGLKRLLGALFWLVSASIIFSLIMWILP